MNEEKVFPKRTRLQNSALHLYFQMIADALNNSGYDMKRTLSQTVDIPWGKDTVKQYLWNQMMRLQLGKTHTSDLTTQEVDMVFNTLNRYLAERFGISAPFPSIEEIINKTRSEDG